MGFKKKHYTNRKRWCLPFATLSNSPCKGLEMGEMMSRAEFSEVSFQPVKENYLWRQP